MTISYRPGSYYDVDVDRLNLLEHLNYCIYENALLKFWNLELLRIMERKISKLEIPSRRLYLQNIKVLWE